MQFQADILGVPVERPAVTETTALGAAYLAGLGDRHSGESQDEIAEAMATGKDAFEPAMSADQRDALYAGWRKAVERARHWAED